MPPIRISMHDTNRHGLSIPFDGAAKVLKAVVRNDDDDDDEGDDDDTLATVNDDVEDDVWARILDTKLSVCSTLEGDESDDEVDISARFWKVASKSYARDSDWGSIDVQLKMTDNFDSSAMLGGGGQHFGSKSAAPDSTERSKRRHAVYLLGRDERPTSHSFRAASKCGVCLFLLFLLLLLFLLFLLFLLIVVVVVAVKFGHIS